MSDYNVAAVVVLFTFPALGGFLFGYDIGATSFVVKQITDGDYDGVKWNDTLEDSDSLQGAVTSASVFGALLASILVFRLSDFIGRRSEIMIGSLLYAVGALIEAISANPDWDANTGLTVLMTGRVVYGLGIGFSMHGAPAYIGEMSPPSIRGLLISLKEAVIVVGILCGYLIGFLLSETKGGWAYVFGIAIFPAIGMFIGSVFLHESARWLFLNDRTAEAKAALEWVLPKDMVESALEDMSTQDNVASNRLTSSKADSQGGAVFRDEQKPSVWSVKYKSALLAGVGLVFLQQVTGQPSVLYYAASIFDDAGLADVATVGMAGFKLVMTMAAVFTVDRFGRKILLYIGISVMFVALIALAIAFNFAPTADDDDDDGSNSISGPQIVILIALFTYIGGYQIGFGPIAWLLISEVFPLEVRGQAVALAVQTNFFWNVVTSYLFPLIVSALGPAWTFGLFAIIDGYALYHVFVFVPETKGLSLEEIEELFDNQRKKKKSEDSVRRPLLEDGGEFF